MEKGQGTEDVRGMMSLRKDKGSLTFRPVFKDHGPQASSEEGAKDQFSVASGLNLQDSSSFTSSAVHLP
jgi:hypothetical protein